MSGRNLLVFLFGVAQLQPALAAEAPPGQPVPIAISAPAMPHLGLADCLRLALHRQPRIAAARASLAGAEDGYRSLEALHVPAILAPELPIRRTQAALGLTSARAAVDVAEREAVYAVMRAWFTVLFAREQEQVARGVVDRLAAVHKTTKGLVEGGDKDVTTVDVNRTLVYLRLAETRQVEAEQGQKRALASLREAVGVGPGFCFEVVAGRLPDPRMQAPRCAVVGWALARRGELVLAGTYAQVVCLEVDAQASSQRRRMETFAAGADVHAREVPQTIRNGEYRPGGVPPEMPTLLAGPRHLRVQHARSLYARAASVVEVTRNLIALEAEDAFLRWQQASRQGELAREAADTAERQANDLSKDFAARAKVTVEAVVNAAVTAAQARGQYNEFIHRKILALADLERITAGAFCAGLLDAGR
jgi:outer membrane protein TolC